MSEEQLSPAQRYAAFQASQKQRKSLTGLFSQSLSFDIDDFQRDACQALENNQNVLVAAPTGAGKTVVADFAIFLAQQRNVKAFYTTPIKALSNQKFHELAAAYGEDRVGLLTGDVSINSEADIVVMTTEVLRNMLYEKSSTLNALGYVVLDEIHYLADRMRGQVWEEVIIHLPDTVKIIGL
ncbi:MAG: DEAD/DEAH box helicase, partial [Alloscardovia omnicolens]|nr:DEAD/DEAH box helicase [Alloscardovia omnicolens]